MEKRWFLQYNINMNFFIDIMCFIHTITDCQMKNEAHAKSNWGKHFSTFFPLIIMQLIISELLLCTLNKTVIIVTVFILYDILIIKIRLYTWKHSLGSLQLEIIYVHVLANDLFGFLKQTKSQESPIFLDHILWLFVYIEKRSKQQNYVSMYYLENSFLLIFLLFSYSSYMLQNFTTNCWCWT